MNMMVSSSTMMSLVSSMDRQSMMLAKAPESVGSSSAPGKLQKQAQGPQPSAVVSGRPADVLPAGARSIPKKPMRPLTAYHIFFQIEREYVIQTTAGDDADKKIHDGKVYLPDVPRRYQNVLLLPDWFAGPGKRRKRKHRKQHGKIGFLELSRVISERWARLDEVDPETKAFVQDIARKELEVYYQEVRDYKEATKDMNLEDDKPQLPPKKKPTKKRVSPTSSLGKMPRRNSIVKPRPDMISSSTDDFLPASVSNDIDNFLYSVKNNMPLLGRPVSFGESDLRRMSSVNSNSSENNFFRNNFNRVMMQERKRKMFSRDGPMDMPSMSCFNSNHSMMMDEMRPMKMHRKISEYNNNSMQMPQMQRRQSAPMQQRQQQSGCASPVAAEVDICDDEILQLWQLHN